MKNTKFLFFSLSLVFLASCASLTGYQDAKTLGKDVLEGGASLNLSRSPDFISDVSSGADVTPIPFPNLELTARYGISEKFDLGVRLNTSLNIGFSGKYQVVGDRQSKVALAIGGELGSFGVISNLWNIQMPLYFSVHPSQKFSWYLSPRYVYQFGAGDLGLGPNLNYYGGNTGILYGSKHKFGLDIGYYGLDGITSSTTNLLTFGIGGKFIISGGDNDDYTPAKSNSTKKGRKKRKA